MSRRLSFTLPVQPATQTQRVLAMTSLGRLTIKRIASIKLQGCDQWLSDNDGVAGYGRLWLRAARSGSRRFYFRRTVDGVTRTTPIGPFSKNARAGFYTLGQAREVARRLALEPVSSFTEKPVAAGPTALIASPHREQQGSSPEPKGTVSELCDAYVEWLKANNKESWRGVRSLLQKNVKASFLGELTAASVTSEQVAELLDSVKTTISGHAALKIRRLLHAAYNYIKKTRTDRKMSAANAAFGITTNPVSNVESLNEYATAGERNLSTTELGQLMRYLSQPRWAEELAGQFVLLDMFLGGQRCKQLLRASKPNVDLVEDILLLFDKKGSKRLQPRKHNLPIVPTARTILQRLVQRSTDLNTDDIFTGRTGRRMTETPIITLINEVCGEMLKNGHVTSKFTYRDLRRTAETRMAALRIPEEIRKQVLSHGITGVQNDHYNRYEYMDEKREALLSWEALLHNLKAEAEATST